MTNGSPATSDNIVTNMRNLIPAEITAVFLALDLNIEDRQSNDIWFIIFFVILAIVSVFYTKYVGKTEGWFQPLLVSFVVFPAWALMIAAPRIDLIDERPFIPTAVILIVGLLIPVINAVRQTQRRTND